MRISTLVLLLVIVLSACNPASTSKLTDTTSLDPLSIGQPVDVDLGDYSLQIHCYGTGSPVVVLEHGFGTDWTYWNNIYMGMPRDVRVCAYNRSFKAHTSQEYVEDLHALLAGAHIEGPYVLVGHNFGGLNVVLYADRFPAEVAGIVLENSLHPDQFTRFMAALPPESPSDSAGLKVLRQKFASPSQYSIDLDASFDQARSVKSLRDIPTIVLTSASPNLEWRDIPADVQAKLDQEQQAMQNELTRLSSDSKQIIATTNQQVIHFYEPQLVIEAIVNMVEFVRSE
jgi:pimeloyl-ACP methyl ester carboxylesterase